MGTRAHHATTQSLSAGFDYVLSQMPAASTSDQPVPITGPPARVVPPLCALPTYSVGYALTEAVTAAILALSEEPCARC